MDIEDMRAQVAAHDEQVAADSKAAVATLVASKAWKEVRAKLAQIAAKGPRSPLDAVLGSLSTSGDLLEQIGG